MTVTLIDKTLGAYFDIGQGDGSKVVYVADLAKLANKQRFRGHEGWDGFQALSAAPRTNLVLQSQAFDTGVSWNKSIGGTGVAAVILANNAVAPDGTFTADTVTFDTGANTTATDQSVLTQSIATTTSSPYTGSFWVRGPNGAKIVFRHAGNSAFTLITLTGVWQRVAVAETATLTSCTYTIGLRQGVTGTINSTVTVDLWGAQFEAGSAATAYIPTTAAPVTVQDTPDIDMISPWAGSLDQFNVARTNHIIQSENMAGWTANNTGAGVLPVVTLNDAVAPDGNLTADKVVLDIGAGTLSTDLSRMISSAAAATLTGNHVFSVWLKTSDGSTKTVELNISGNGIGIVTVTPTWQRFTSATYSVPTLAVGARIQLRGDAGTSKSASLHIWGMQLEAGTVATSYIPTVATAVTVTDYSASAARTNLCPNSQAFDLWSQNASLATTPNATTAPDGATTADLLAATLAGASYAGASPTIGIGVPCIASAYVKNIDSVMSVLHLRSASDSGRVQIAWSGSTIISVLASSGATIANYQSVGNGWYRVWFNCTTAEANPVLRLYPDSNSTNKSIYAWGAQLEAGSGDPTGYIPTGSSSASLYDKLLIATWATAPPAGNRLGIRKFSNLGILY